MPIDILYTGTFNNPVGATSAAPAQASGQPLPATTAHSALAGLAAAAVFAAVNSGPGSSSPLAGLPAATGTVVVSGAGPVLVPAGMPAAQASALTPFIKPVTLVSAGTAVASGSPAFGQATAAGHLLVAWVGSESGGTSFDTTTSSSGWTKAVSAGAQYGWVSIWYKPNCGTGESPPVFSAAGGGTMVSRLAEFSGALTSSVLDRTGTSGVTWSAWTATCSASDSQAGDLIVACGNWDGSAAGGTLAIVSPGFTDCAGSPVSGTLTSLVSGSDYFCSVYGVSGVTGSLQDSITVANSAGNYGDGVIASFKAASPPPNPLAIAPVTPIGGMETEPYQPLTFTATGGLPPYTWSVSSGSLPAGLSLSGAVISGTPTAAGTSGFTVKVTDSASNTATSSMSITVIAPPAGTTLTSSLSNSNSALGPYNVPSWPNNNGFNIYVDPNIQNAIAGFSQSTYAYDQQTWWTVTTAPAGNGSVLAGPQTNSDFISGGQTALTCSELTAFTSSYACSMPLGAGIAAEAAYDIWTDWVNPSNGGGVDIMIWLCVTDTRGTGGATLIQPDVTISGVTYDVYQFGGAGQYNEMIFITQGPGGTGTWAHEMSGTNVNILGVVNWATAYLQGVYGTNVTGGQISSITFTFEICSTNNTPQIFAVSDLSYSIS